MKKSSLKQITLTSKQRKTLAIYRAICEETKYKILISLSKGEVCACEIPSLIGKTQSNTSMHLAKLSQIGVLKSRRDGKKILYSISDKTLLNFLNQFSQFQRIQRKK